MIDYQGLSKKYLRHVVFGLLFLAAVLSSFSKFFELYELQTYDLRCQWRGARPVSDKIILVDIWNDTLQQLGAWPIDREYHAELIKILKQYGARAVAFDVLFVEPKAGDDIVAATASAAGNVYFAQSFSKLHHESPIYVGDQITDILLPSYAQSAKGVGHINQQVDIDGKNRRVYPAIIHNNKTYYHMGLQMALEALGVPEARLQKQRHGLRLKDAFDIPLDEEDCFIINYAGQWETTFQHYSYFDILMSYVELSEGQKPRIDPAVFKDKVCFVGLTSVGAHDTKPVPIQSIYPMVGMHANAANTILMRDFIRRADRVTNTLILLVLLIICFVVVLKLKPLRALLATLVLVSTVILVGFAAFAVWGFWIDLFTPVFWLLVFYATGTLLRTLFEMRKRELIENELKIASQIQKSFLPETLPDFKGLTLAVYMKPAKAVGGDLYTFVSLGDTKLGVMLGDVSGKGTPAALFMAKTVSEFKFSARDKTDPSEVLTSLNNSIASESTGGLFVTLTYLMFDLAAKKMVMSDGGHLPVITVSGDGHAEQLNAEQGMPIGVAPDVPFSIFERPIKSGDIFALYSDGVSEARNRKKDEYGIETLEKKLQQLKALSAKDILDKTIEDLNHFMGKADQHDDITLLIVKVS